MVTFARNSGTLFAIELFQKLQSNTLRPLPFVRYLIEAVENPSNNTLESEKLSEGFLHTFLMKNLSLWRYPNGLLPDIAQEKYYHPLLVQYMVEFLEYV